MELTDLNRIAVADLAMLLVIDFIYIIMSCTSYCVHIERWQRKRILLVSISTLLFLVSHTVNQETLDT